VSTAFWVSYALLWALAVFSSLVLLGLVRATYGGRDEAQQPDLPQDALGSLGAGTPAPAVVATRLNGARFASGDWAGQRTALLFVSPDCMSCKVTLPELEALHHKVDGNLVVVCRSTRGRCAQMAEEYGLSVPVIVDDDEDVSRQFSIDIAPTAVLIATDGTVEASGHPMSAEDLERMVANFSPPETVTVITPG